VRGSQTRRCRYDRYPSTYVQHHPCRRPGTTPAQSYSYLFVPATAQAKRMSESVYIAARRMGVTIDGR